MISHFFLKPIRSLALTAAKPVLVIFASSAFITLLLLTFNTSPMAVASALFHGAFSSWLKFSYVLSIFVPLLLCSTGLLFTFRIGLWNIGIEGQVILGAIGATMILRLYPLGLPPTAHIGLAFLASFAGGALWGGLAGWLKRYGGVNEIFGGLGLNFVAQGLILWLILGPWKRSGIASMSGTDLFARELWLSPPPGWQVSPPALVLAVTVFAFCTLLLLGTRFGLHIKASGHNAQAARLYAIDPARLATATMTIGGGLAGVAGGIQALCVYHRLLPAISSGYGYLALLVVMLAGYRPFPVPAICMFFAALAAGSIQLPLILQLDSSLAGVIQGSCVICALLFNGFEQRRRGTD